MSTVTVTIPLVKQTFSAGTAPSDLQFRLRNTATNTIVQTKVIAPSALPPIPADGSSVSVSMEFANVADGGYEMLIRRLRMVGGVLFTLGTEVKVPFAVPGTAIDALVPGEAAGVTITVAE